MPRLSADGRPPPVRQTIIQPAVAWPTDRPARRGGGTDFKANSPVPTVRLCARVVHCAKTVGTSRYRPAAAAAARRRWRRWRRWRRRRRRRRWRWRWRWPDDDLYSNIAGRPAPARRFAPVTHPPPLTRPPRKTAAEDSRIIINNIYCLC